MGHCASVIRLWSTGSALGGEGCEACGEGGAGLFVLGGADFAGLEGRVQGCDYTYEA